MCNLLTLNPVKLINGVIDLPGSKSITNRALILSCLSEGKTKLFNLLYSDDTKYMLNAIKSLGVDYNLSNSNKICEIIGIKNNFKNTNSIKLFVGNAGTVMRTLTSILCLTKGNIILTGDKRMKERPIGDLVDALKQGGAKINYICKKNFPPIEIQGGFKGGLISINCNISSQYLTSLLILCPLAKNDTTIIVNGKLVSKPYIDITLNMLKTFGININNINYKKFLIQGNQIYISPKKYLIEGDATSASYFLAASAIKGGKVRVNGIGKLSIQGDIYFAKILEKMGATINWGNNYIECIKHKDLTPISIDANNIPDSAMTLAVVALFTKDKYKNITKIKNIYNWRIKETDRLHAMSNELRKTGASIEEGSDYIYITPPKKIKDSIIETYNDHRIAMSFSLVSLSKASITILNPTCTSKTFPNFFEKFFKLCNK